MVSDLAGYYLVFVRRNGRKKRTRGEGLVGEGRAACVPNREADPHFINRREGFTWRLYVKCRDFRG